MATFFAACTTSDEVLDVSSRQIQLTGTCQRTAGKYPSSTRAAEKDTLSPDYHMYVSAVHHLGNESPYTYLKAREFTCDDQHIWSSPGCNYPVDGGTIDFLAYAITSPANIPTATVTTNQTTFDKIELNFNKKLTAIDPIVYSDLILSQNCEGNSEPLPLNFNHATSCVQVSVDAEDDESRALLAISDITIADVIVGGNLDLKVQGNQVLPEWKDKQTSSNYELENFHALSQFPAEQIIYPLQSTDPTTLTLSYTFGNNTPRTFSYPCPDAWRTAERNIYRFTVKAHRVEISADAWETPWDTEIGSGAYEPDWSVETTTGAYEATWGEEIGDQAYEITWRVEIGVTALEASWLTEILGTASEDGWNSEIGSNAGENGWNSEIGSNAEENDWNSEIGNNAEEDGWNSEIGNNASEDGWNSEIGNNASEDGWNSETGGSAAEENWTEETRGCAYEATWEPGEDIVIGGN